MATYAEYLRQSALDKGLIDDFLDPHKQSWARFDPELGYVLSNSVLMDGIDHSNTISTAAENGMRTQHNYAGKPCRINTYGNSFTQGAQVSDGETWQEYLAAHLGEPIRNFGMGGHGVYQAYRRMLRTEAGADKADNIILYMWGDDHHRSVMRCRHAATYPWHEIDGVLRPFHGNFWANIEMDLETGKLTEKASICPTPESLYNMSDPEFMHESLKDDLMVAMYAAVSMQGCAGMAGCGYPMAGLRRLAEILETPMLEGDDDGFMGSLKTLRNKYAYSVTKYILTECDIFAKANKKNLLVILFDPYEATKQIIRNETRTDQEIVDFIEENRIKFFDMNHVHAKDFKCFNLSLEDYYSRYFIGHYNPTGNHFFAFSLKDTVVDWLDPKPVTYQNRRSDDALLVLGQ